MKRFAALLTVMLLVLTMASVVSAHPVPDLTRQDCSITVTMHMGQEIIPGGMLQLYRVGEIRQEDGSYVFAPAGDFADCGLSFEKVSSPALAARLARLAQNLEPLQVVKVDKNATATFDGLATGLYLVIQSKAASGYQKAEPFLVSVPYYDELTDTYDYTVDAFPKVDVEKQTEPPPTKPPQLPQTGQTNWPVPVLLVLGVGLMLLGALLRGGRKMDENET